MDLKIKKPRQFLIHPNRDDWRSVDNAVVDRLINGIPGIYFQDRPLYRYLLTIIDGNNPLEIWANINQLPSIETEIVNFGHGISLMGRQRWNNLDVTINDIVDDNKRHHLYQIFNRLMTRDDIASYHRNSESFILEQIDVTGVTAQKWNIHGIISQYISINGNIDFTIMINYVTSEF